MNMNLISTHIDDKWDILEYTDTKKQKSYYSRHNCCTPGNRPWMMESQRVCYNCQLAVPDHIQAIMTLMAWR